MNSASGTESGPEQEQTEFLAGALVGVDEMKRFGVGVTHHVLEIGAHIHELLGGGGGGGGEAGGDDAGTDGDALHGAEDVADAVSGAAAGGEAGLLAVAKGSPEGDGAEGAGVGGCGALKGDADDAVPHFSDEVVGGERQLKKKGRF